MTSSLASGKPSMTVKPVVAIVAVAFGISVLCGSTERAQSQQAPDTPVEETVANLAAGRVVLAVVKDAIIAGTIENPIEPETHVPEPVVLASERFGVLLGAVEWWSPSSNLEIAQLERELPHLRTYAVAAPPHLGQSQGGDEASDIEIIGQGLLERLNEAAQGLHSNVQLPPDEPLTELILADYLAGYGPEIWQLSYGLKQEQQQNDYWTSRVLQPRYEQFWPPEKGQPHTLVEFDYPPENAAPTLLELLRHGDRRLEAIRSSDAQMGEVASRLVAGESDKLNSTEVVQFLRAALDATAPAHARETMAILKPETGLSWILAPPAEPARHRPQPNQNRPANAPTLQPEGAPTLAPH
jgi:hypothetical protein